MRKFLLIATAVFLMAPVALMANGIDFASVGGTVAASGSPTTLSTTTSSTLKAVTGPSSSVTGSDIGTISFTTGGMTSGSLSTSAMFGSGGSITVATNSNFTGDANDASAFTGSFTALSWAPLAGSTDTWQLAGTATGTFSSTFASLFGLSTTGGSGPFISAEVLQSGNNYSITSIDLNVPEASTMSLLGFGLFALFAAAYWRRRQEVLVAE